MTKKMKRQLIQLGVVAVLLVGAIAAFLLLREEPVEEEAPVTQETYIVGGSTSLFVKSVDIRNEAGEFTIVNDAENAIQQENNANSTYSIPGLETADLNQSTLKSIINAVASLPSKRVVVESGGDLALYGLDNPRGTLVIAYESSDATLYIGDEAPGNEGVYVSREGSEAIHLVEKTRITNMLKGQLDFVSTTITPGNSQTTLVSAATLSGTLYDAPITIVELEADEASSLIGLGRYQITAPIAATADSSSAVPTLQQVFGLTAEAVVDVADFMSEDAATYGLAEPYFLGEMIPAVNEGEEAVPAFSLALSAPDEDGKVYAQSSLASYVYQLSATGLDFLDLTLFDYQEKMIVLPHIDSISEVEVLAGGEAYTFVLQGEGDELLVSCDDSYIDPKNFRQFYQTLIAARYDSEIDGGGTAATEETGTVDGDPAEEDGEAEAAEEQTEATAPSDGDVVLRYTYRFRDGTPDTVVEFRSGPARRAIVSLDGGTAYYAQSVYVDRVLEDLPKVIAGEEVKSYL